jgi:hypothetical protein
VLFGDLAQELVSLGALVKQGYVVRLQLLHPSVPGVELRLLSLDFYVYLLDVVVPARANLVYVSPSSTRVDSWASLEGIHVWFFVR